MVKSKIEARERALELAISWGKIRDVRPRDIIECAENFAEYIIGEAEIPEKEPSIEEITAKSIEKILAASNAQNLGTMGIIGGFNMGGNESNS
jgi:hypothetical protein